jgi:serine/threonine-protein kinase
VEASFPERLGRYELLERLASDATSIAWRARDPELDRLVLVEAPAIPDDATASERVTFGDRFLEQARRAAGVTHTSLLVIHDSGRDEATGRPFVVQELVPGRTLAEALVPGQPLPWEEALRLVGALGRAIQQLHAADLVHRAVRPSNVRLLEGRPPKLADAGLTRFETNHQQPSRVSESVVESLYVSPEQIVGERVDARSDIFSLAAVAYRLVAGCDAFAADTPREVLARVSHDRPRPVSQIVSGLPPGLDDVLGQALATARKDRYADIGAFCDDLEDLLAGKPPRHARPEAAREDAGRLLAAAPGSGEGESKVTGAMLKRRRSAVRIAAAVAALALVAGLELLRRRLDSPGPPRAAPSVDLDRREGAAPPSDGVELPSLASAEPARLSLDFRHTLERGTLVVTVDGTKLLERKVSAAVKKSVLGIKLREGSLREVIELPPGRHEVAVRVSWGDDQRSERVAGLFKPGATRRLTARVARIGKRLTLEWE